MEEEAIQKIEQNGNRPEEWLELITKVRPHSTLQHVLHLFGRAACRISAEENRKNPTYAKFFLEYARLQEKTSSDAARSIHQLARSNATRFAVVHVAWAQFELSQGNSSKCRKLLKKAKEYGAEPMAMLDRAYEAYCYGSNRLLDQDDTMTTELFGPGQTSTLANTSADSSGNSSSDSNVISFKLPDAGKNRVTMLRKWPSISSSSSSDDTDTQPSIPLQGHGVMARPVSMSAQKPRPISETPDIKKAERNLAGNLNLSVRRPKAKRGLSSSGRKLPLPQRATERDETERDATKRNTPSDANELDGIRALEPTEPGEQNVEQQLANRNRELEIIREVEEAGSKSADAAGSLHAREPRMSPHSSGLQFPGQGSVGSWGGLSAHMSSGTLNGGHPPQVQSAQPLPQNTITVNGKVYQTQGIIGKGGSSKVYRAFDGERVCAIKRVCLEFADERVVQCHLNEINLLKRLQGKDNIIKMFDWELHGGRSALLLVMECGSIDLAGYLRKNRSKITTLDLASYWKQMLDAVRVIHEEGIIHTDLKPANFLFVEGQLKLIDFGIANDIQDDKTSIERNAQVGTLNFMSPESIQDISHGAPDPAGPHKPRMKIGRPSDVWSLGCILYAMVYGKTPFQHITNSLVKLQCILDSKHVITFPPIENEHLLDVMKGCLRRDPRTRHTIPQLLAHAFITRAETSQPAVVAEEQLFSFLMDFSRSAVNSPRSVRAISKALHDKLQAGGCADISSVVTNVSQRPPRPPQATTRRPLVDVHELQKAQKDLKALSMSGSARFMGGAPASNDKENSNLESVLRQGLENKYKNALPAETPDSTFDQSWTTTAGT